MQAPEDHGGGDMTNKYCMNCAPDGELKDREWVRSGWIDYVMETENLPKEEAGKRVDTEMAKMPAWQA
jgi:hypothetical protein